MHDDIVTYPTVALGSLAASGLPAFGDADPLGIFSFLFGAYGTAPVYRHGYVQTYNPNTHSASVNVCGAQSVWTCVFADELLSYSFGFSMSHPAREGDAVLLLEIGKDANAGIIIGRIPNALCFAGEDLYSDPDQYHRRSYTQDDKEKRTWDRNIACYMAPLENKHDNSSHIATHFRPTDVYPGEFAHLNQHNCGIKGGLFSATLLGGGAQLRMSALTNAARLSCESYRRISMLGNIHEYHNGRYLSAERDIALYQEERLGGCRPHDDVWTDDAEAPKRGENQTIRPRVKELSGYFGHLVSRFCLRPDQTEETLRVHGESTPVDEGVSRETIDPSGQYRLSAAGMIAIERTGRIPVPVRTCYPTDKGHDVKKDPEILKPFEHQTDGDPAYRQLELFDRQAYDLKNQYARVDGLGTDEEDFHVPQEEELAPAKDSYDENFFGNRTVELEKYDKRRAGVYIGEDGSVIVRDAWGSEIVMLGGNITLACAGNVQILPGKTALTLAGDDIVNKAQNSIDIHASAHDVRLSAARNMEILGGGDEKSSPGGVVIESRGGGFGPWEGDGDDKGEDTRLSGITLRTKKQGIVIDGTRVNIRSRKDMRILSCDKKMDGNISIAAKTIRTRSRTATISTKDSAISISPNGITETAKSIGIYSENSLTALKGGKYPQPLKWVDVDNVAEDLIPQFNEYMKDLDDEKEASAGFDSEALEKMVFSFRTSMQCGTDKNWTIGASGPFTMYEPAWVQVMNVYETLRSGGVKAKKYEENAEWENGKPWPGKDAEDSALYAELGGMTPENLTSDGFNKSRKDVVERSNITTEDLKSGYRIRT